MSRSEHERGPEQHHLAVVAIRERDEALLRAGKAEGDAERLRAWLVYLDEATEDDNLRAAIALALKGEAPDPVGGR